MKTFVLMAFLSGLSSIVCGEAKEEILCSSKIGCTTSMNVLEPEAKSNFGNQFFDFFTSILDTRSWPARWQCGEWSPFHGWLYIFSDVTIALSYFLIPLILFYFVYRGKQQPHFRIVVGLFILFILACGSTHLIDASIFWWPAYRLSALLRFVTAFISLGTVFALVKISPQLLQWKSPESLERIVHERTDELNKSMSKLKMAEKDIAALNEELEQKVIERTGQLAIVNKELEATIKQVRESEEKFSKIFDASPVGISISVLPSGILVDVNKSLLKMYGFKHEEIIGHSATELNMVATDTREKIIQELMQGAKIRDREIIVRSKSGTEFPVLFSIDQFAMEEKRFVITFTYDITERKKAEQRINQLNIGLEENLQQLTIANKEMESFSYSVSHDLRSPLRSIDGYAKMLEEDFANILDEEGKRLLRAIQHNAKKMGNLIDDLLAFSRLGRHGLQSTTVNMKEIAENILIDLNISTDHKAKVEIANLQPVLADQSLISQVLINLLSNAIKYSSKVENPVVEIKSKLGNGEIVYSVKDNGVGFDMKYADKLFGVFQRLHKANEFDGTGVGLAIAHRIITKHGGKIWADAKLGEGATFFFSLPI